MHVELMRDARKEFPGVPNASSVTSMKVWHCGFRTLRPLEGLTNVKILEIATYPDDSFELLQGLRDLSYLYVLHLPHVTDLEPLSRLTSLTTLRLSTLPSWDSSGKRTVVESLEPLARLRDLKHLELFGVVPHDRSLAPLEGLRFLQSIRVSKYPRKETQSFYDVTGLDDSFAPEPRLE